MGLETCRLCGKIFEAKFEFENDSLLCRECMMNEELVIKHVQKFLDSRKKDVLCSQIRRKTGVSKRYLQHLIDDGKIKLNNRILDNCGELTINQIYDKCKMEFKYEADKIKLKKKT